MSMQLGLVLSNKFIQWMICYVGSGSDYNKFKSFLLVAQFTQKPNYTLCIIRKIATCRYNSYAK